ncbi:MAG: hypothetical protein ACXVQU_05905 [Actinomycetota bacterium]
MNPSAARRSGVALAASVILASCGAPLDSPSAGTPAPVVVAPVLTADAVPGVPSTTNDVTASDLAKDASIPGLVSKITAFGFVGGRERTFQGESKHLTYVLSRSLAFASSTGANEFVAFVRSEVEPFFGVGARARPIEAQGRDGWLFAPPACACHLANPVLVGVLRDGRDVIWLEINGPDASRPVLFDLLRPANFDAPAG